MTLAAGIVVPVFIHLWHRRPGKVLKISSVQLLSAASVRHARSWRISDWWLLLLRCLIIILLALLLSQPVWHQPLTTRTVKGWLIVEKAAYPVFNKQIDSLLQAGFQLHSPDTAFARLGQPADLPPDTASSSYWELVQSLSQKVPVDLPVYLFTGNRLARFSGPLPAVALTLHWQTMTPADSVDNWKDYTYLTDKDSLRIRQGSSTPAGTGFSWQDTLPGTDTSTLTYTIFTDKHPEDARYLEAALKAVQQYTHRKTNLRLVKQLTAVPAMQDWLWWLSDSPVPAQVKAGRIIRYASGKPLQQSSTIAGTGIRVFQRLPLTDTSGTVWRDSYGTPLLTTTTLYTHLNPAWNELPWSGEFPEKLLELIYPVTSGKQHDRRAIDIRQVQHTAIRPGQISEISTNRVHQRFHHVSQRFPLEKITWIILFLVFCIERYLSSKTAATRE